MRRRRASERSHAAPRPRPVRRVARTRRHPQGKMDQALKGIGKLLKTSNNGQIAVIFVLVVIFLITAIIALS